MQLKPYLKLRGMTYEDLLPKLKEIAEPGELDDLSVSTISRHARGEFFPPARMQDLYDRATEGAVKPQDWVDLHRDLRARRGEEEDSESVRV
jgi:hypothetical protein